ncbi:MAG: c-type cytochrome [Verrucomicrobia bacterium]|nr:c-type cytochrome [Verrucomicrobiota bacterium]
MQTQGFSLQRPARLAALVLLLSGLGLGSACSKKPERSAGSVKQGAVVKVAAGSGAAAVAAAGGDRNTVLAAMAKDKNLVKLGGENFEMFCVSCHGRPGALLPGVADASPSNLFDQAWFHGGLPSEIEKTIVQGFNDKGMPAWDGMLEKDKIESLVAYIYSFQTASKN